MSTILLSSSSTGSIRRNNSSSLSPVQLLYAVTLTLMLSACTVSKQLDTPAIDDTLVTGSISAPAKEDGLNETDANTIKQVVVQNDLFNEGSNLLSWNNAETGNSGTITAIEQTLGSQGRTCRKFETTVNSFSGVSIYNGETCEVTKNSWALSWLLPKDFGV